MPNLYIIIGGAVTILGLLLSAFFSFKKTGINEEKSRTLTQEVKDDKKTMDEVAKANEFLSRINNDPDFRKRMRDEIGKS